jgi:aminoglycoside 2'-N-acetyltransferase I
MTAGLRRALLDAAFAGDFTDDDWDHTCGGWRVEIVHDDVPAAHAAVVPRTLWIDDRPFATGYIEGVAVAPAMQRRGLGTAVMRAVTDLLHANFELGFLSTSVEGFYERLGWERWQGASYVQDGSTRVRTEDEDDGLMALRFGPSAGVELTASVTCEARTGEDW